MKKTVLILLFIALSTQTGWCRTVGIWRDARSVIPDGLLATLRDAGWEIEFLVSTRRDGNDLHDTEKLDRLDAIFLSGGHNAYQFADFEARRNLVRYTAGGGGLLAAANRGGYVRTANRPFFPEIGEIYNRVNGPWVQAYGDSELAQSISEPFCPGNWDHLVAKVGSDGRVFAVSGDDPVGVYGETYGGRHVLFGAYIGLNATEEPMTGVNRNVLLTMLDWLSAAPAPSDEARTKYQEQADRDFLRRERLYDWTLHERGPDRRPGILPQMRHRLAIPLENRLYRLRYMQQWLGEANSDRCREAAGELERALADFNERYERTVTEVTERMHDMDVEILSVGKEAFPEDMSRDRIRERLFEAEELNRHVAAADTAIEELWPSVTAAKAGSARGCM